MPAVFALADDKLLYSSLPVASTSDRYPREARR